MRSRAASATRGQAGRRHDGTPAGHVDLDALAVQLRLGDVRAGAEPGQIPERRGEHRRQEAHERCARRLIKAGYVTVTAPRDGDRRRGVLKLPTLSVTADAWKPGSGRTRRPGRRHARQGRRRRRVPDCSPSGRAVRRGLSTRRQQWARVGRRTGPESPVPALGPVGATGATATQNGAPRAPSSRFRFVRLTKLPAQSGRRRTPRPVSPKRAQRRPACTWRSARTGRRQRAHRR